MFDYNNNNSNNTNSRNQIIQINGVWFNDRHPERHTVCCIRLYFRFCKTLSMKHYLYSAVMLLVFLIVLH